MNSLTAAELNLLVYRYLLESDFIHGAFSFGHEAGKEQWPIDCSLVQPGALVTIVQKGLQFIEMEANRDSEMDEDYTCLQPLDIITKDVNELQQFIKGKRKEEHEARGKELDKEHDGAGRQVIHRDKQDTDKEHEKVRERTEQDKPRKPREDHSERKMSTNRQGKRYLDLEDDRKFKKTRPTTHACEIPGSDVMILEGHSSEVRCCAWSPAGYILASGSRDSTARIWTIADGSNRSSFGSGPLNVIELKHAKGKTNEKNKYVTALDWNGDGTLLATGSYDGQARLWNTNGELKSTLSKHEGRIFSLKWNKRGDYVLTGSSDRSAIVWDVTSGEFKQQFQFHSGPTLDADWRNNVSFATSSSDRMIFVCKVGDTQPIRRYSGHRGDVNCVKWDPTGLLLASCSDDITVKIWSVKQIRHVHDLREHAKEIYTIRWSPTGPGTDNPNLPLVLASASFDSTVKLWDVEQGKRFLSLSGHRDNVYSVAFSPNGKYLATGSRDKSLHIWSVTEGKIIKTYTGNAGIFEVCWSREGSKVAACFADNTVCVVDFRM